MFLVNKTNEPCDPISETGHAMVGRAPEFGDPWPIFIKLVLNWGYLVLRLFYSFVVFPLNV